MLKDVGTYNGEPNMTKLRTFVDKIELIVKHEMVPPDLVVDFVTSKLTGLGYTWWQSIPPLKKSTIVTWHDLETPDGGTLPGLKHALFARFAPENYSRDTLRKLKEIRPKAFGSNSINEYIAQFNSLAYSLPESLPDYVYQDYFLNALPNDLASLVQADVKNIETLDKLQSATARIAASLHKKKPTPSPHSPANAAQTDADDNPSGGKPGQQQKPKGPKKEGDNPKSGSPKQGRPRTPKCPVCAGHHFIKNCDVVKKAKAAHDKGNNKDGAASTNNVEVLHVEARPDNIFEALIDSGATDHMTPHKSNLDPNSIYEDSRNVLLADSTSIKSTVRGTVRIEAHGFTDSLELRETLHVPGLRKDLVSIAKCNDHGVDVLFKHTGDVIFTRNDREIAKGARRNNAFYLQGRLLSESLWMDPEVCHVEVGPALAHARLGHAGRHVLDKMPSVTRGWSVVGDVKDFKDCEACVLGKAARLPFPPGNSEPRELCELIHSDLQGPFRVTGYEGSRYSLEFIEHKSRYVVAYPIPNKESETVLKKFLEFKAWIEKQTDRQIKVLLTDRGGEYFGAVITYLKKHGIQHQPTTAYSSQQNGIAERWHRTGLDRTRAILADSQLPRRFWPAILQSVAYLHSLTYSRTTHKTPHEVLFGKVPDVAHLRRVGCVAYMVIPSKGRDKMGNRARKSYLLGYAHTTGTKAYLLWDPIRDKVEISRDVVFKENLGLETAHKENPDTLDLLDAEVEDSDDEEYAIESILNERQHKANGKQYRVKWVGYKTPTWEPATLLEDTQALDAWESRIQAYAAKARGGNNINPNALTYKQAMKTPQKEQYLEAARKEYQSLMDNGTWKLVPRPRDKRVVGSTWVFKPKINPDGTFAKFKARAVAQGFTQVPGRDFDETYAPTLPLPALRLFLAYSVLHGFDIHSMDAITAFLNSPIDKEVFVEQFEGFEHPDYPKEAWVLLLLKALYGLKQAPLLWYITLKAALEELGYTAVTICPCIFFKYAAPGRPTSEVQHSPETLVLLKIFVDDFLVSTKNPELMRIVKEELHTKFKFTDQGRVSNHLGLVYKYDFDSPIRTLEFSNVKYIDNMLERFKMSDCHPVDTPFAVSARAQPSTDSTAFDKPPLYQEAVGALTWAATTWRWDIATAVGYAARQVSAPTNADWQNVKRIFRYLKGTREFSIKYTSQLNDPVGLRLYTDADYAGDITDRKSTTGILALYNGYPILWKSSKQTCVAQSTTEAEYIAAATGHKDAIWFRQILAEVLGTQPEHKEAPVPQHVDNQSAGTLIKTSTTNNRTKHIDVRYHAVRDAAARKLITIIDTKTEDELADFFTKPFAKDAHQGWVDRISHGNHIYSERTRDTEASIQRDTETAQANMIQVERGRPAQRIKHNHPTPPPQSQDPQSASRHAAAQKEAVHHPRRRLEYGDGLVPHLPPPTPPPATLLLLHLALPPPSTPGLTSPALRESHGLTTVSSSPPSPSPPQDLPSFAHFPPYDALSPATHPELPPNEGDALPQHQHPHSYTSRLLWQDAASIGPHYPSGTLAPHDARPFDGMRQLQLAKIARGLSAVVQDSRALQFCARVVSRRSFSLPFPAPSFLRLSSSTDTHNIRRRRGEFVAILAPTLAIVVVPIVSVGRERSLLGRLSGLSGGVGMSADSVIRVTASPHTCEAPHM